MKRTYIILILMLGFLLMPATTYSCGSGKHSCRKEISKTQKDESAAGHLDSHEKDRGCANKCGDKQCGCSSSTSTAALTINPTIELPNKASAIVTGRQRFYHSKSDLSPGFHSLWLIPKIS